MQVIGGQACRIPQMTREEKKILFNEKTGRISPNAESSERDQEFEGIGLEAILAGLCGRQVRSGGRERKVGQDPGSSQAHGYT